MKISRRYYKLFILHLFLFLAFLPTLILSKGKQPPSEAPDQGEPVVTEEANPAEKTEEPAAQPEQPAAAEGTAAEETPAAPEASPAQTGEVKTEEAKPEETTKTEPTPETPQETQPELEKAEPPSEAVAEEPSVVIPEGGKVHTVWVWQETKDCLWQLSKKYYGDPWQWKKIYLANQDTILDPKVIFPKQKIIIPPLN